MIWLRTPRNRLTIGLTSILRSLSCAGDSTLVLIQPERAAPEKEGELVVSVSFVENNLFPAGLLRAGAGAKGEAGELAWLSSDGFRLFTSIAMNKA